MAAVSSSKAGIVYVAPAAVYARTSVARASQPMPMERMSAIVRFCLARVMAVK